MVDSIAAWLTGEDRCRQCHAPAARLGLCAACLHALPWNDSACPRCALPLAEGRCPACIARLPPWAAAHCALHYEAPVRSWIADLKYHARLSAARLLGGALALSLSGAGFTPPELLVPVPLHARRLRDRGFNQAQEIARHLGRGLRIPLRARAVQQLRPTGDQVGLSAARRRRNLRGAFAADSGAVRHRYVALVDDVLTTGATAAALSEALYAAGAARVEVWCCARTL